MEQWIVISIIVALILTIVVYLVYSATRILYPEGKIYKMRWAKRRVNLIIHNQVGNVANNPAELKSACLNVVKALVAAHDQMLREGLSRDNMSVSGSVAASPKYFQEINVYIVPAELLPYECKAFIRKIYGVPTIIVPNGYVMRLIQTGEPVINEACHIVLGDYAYDCSEYTKDPTIWASEGEETLQVVTRRVYLLLTSTLQAR